MVDWGHFTSFFSTGIPPRGLVSSLVYTVLMLIIGLLWKKVKNKKEYSLWILLIEYLFIVISSTIICRPSVNFKFDRLELIPFWTYKCVLAHAPGVSVWDIVLNVVLFISLGFLMKLIFPSLNALKMLWIALLFSLFIETNQYFFEKGVTHIDDMMHNIIGAEMGWSLAFGITNLRWRKKHDNESIICLSILLSRSLQG